MLKYVSTYCEIMCMRDNINMAKYLTIVDST